MRISLAPMQYMAQCCTVCGRAMNKPERAADDEDIHGAMLAACSNVKERISVHCPKCGKWTSNKRVVNRLLKAAHKVAENAT